MMYPSALSLSSCANSAGTELLAIACSQLTGDRWGGEVVLCDAVTLRPCGTLRTASGATDVQWLSGSGFVPQYGLIVIRQSNTSQWLF
jgi:hypothetical protein